MDAMRNRQASDRRRGLTGAFDAFFAELAQDGIRLSNATFSDAATESAYQRHLFDEKLPRERVLYFLGISIFVLFGCLDFLTAGPLAEEILFIRLAVATPLVLLVQWMTFQERFKRVYDLLAGFGGGLMGLAIIAMIAVMPEQGAPPYIIGVLVVMIYMSCVMRMRFVIATVVFLTQTIAYLLVLATKPGFTQVDIASGVFFMMSIAAVAIATNYVQEARARQIWRRNRQREIDARNIEQLLIEATAADRAKISFLSIISHEMRTPLHQIVGFSQVVQNEARASNPDAETPYLDEIINSASGLLKTISKMLRYADATAGKISYELEKCRADHLVDTIREQSRALADRRSVRVEAPQIEPAALLIDHPHTSYAVGHLVENAINASKPGDRVTIAGAVQDGAYVLTVSDAGSGMTAAQIEQAFAPFTQNEHYKTRSTEGLGIGLTLARKILEGENAELRLASTPNKGTVATVILPLAPAAKAAVAP